MQRRRRLAIQMPYQLRGSSTWCWTSGSMLDMAFSLTFGGEAAPPQKSQTLFSRHHAGPDRPSPRGSAIRVDPARPEARAAWESPRRYTGVSGASSRSSRSMPAGGYAGAWSSPRRTGQTGPTPGRFKAGGTTAASPSSSSAWDSRAEYRVLVARSAGRATRCSSVTGELRVQGAEDYIPGLWADRGAEVTGDAFTRRAIGGGRLLGIERGIGSASPYHRRTSLQAPEARSRCRWQTDRLHSGKKAEDRAARRAGGARRARDPPPTPASARPGQRGTAGAVPRTGSSRWGRREQDHVPSTTKKEVPAS